MGKDGSSCAYIKYTHGDISTNYAESYIPAHINPLPTIASVLTKQKAIYTVLTPSIKSPI